MTSRTTTFSRSPWYADGRRRNVAIAAGVGVLSAAVLWWPGEFGWGGTSHHHSTLASIRIDWPADGESALAVVGRGRRASPDAARRVPIASLAKVMTAYVVLTASPLHGDEAGFTLGFTDNDAEQASAEASDGQSTVRVQAGEELTERQALDALLIPSANNVAQALAEHVSGSTTGFVRAMNQQATRLGMRHTSYTDPSGLDATTVSTAADQLRLARAAMRNPVFARIVRMAQATIPVAGTIENTDALLGHDGFVGIKTGSDDAAGGCFMFESRRRSNGHAATVVGVVLGQRNGPFIAAGLSAAQQMVDGVMRQLAHTR
jgi:D-alanyl-D-alanine carboxypeptidase (penicillin-binding protein 5/6)